MNAERNHLKWLAAVVFVMFFTSSVPAVDIPTDTSVGTWDEISRTYTLTQDVSGPIEIVENNLTLDGDGYTVSNDSGSTVYLKSRTGVTITRVNTIHYGPGEAIVLLNCGNCTLIDNTSSNNHIGVFLMDTVYSSLIGNNFSNNSVGIHSYFYGKPPDHLDIIGNIVSGNVYGILLDFSLDHFISDNTVTNNTYGIDLIWGTRNSMIVRNTISCNDYGILISDLQDSQVYNNNFIDNVNQFWGYADILNLPAPVGGNYWSDWTGPDADGDGFVDLPYVLEYVQDNLPWTRQNGWLAPEPEELIQDLIAEVESLEDLTGGIRSALTKTLEAALIMLSDDNPSNDIAAANDLKTFIKLVQAQRRKKISEEDADALIAAAQEIIDLLTSE